MDNDAVGLLSQWVGVPTQQINVPIIEEIINQAQERLERNNTSSVNQQAIMDISSRRTRRNSVRHSDSSETHTLNTDAINTIQDIALILELMGIDIVRTEGNKQVFDQAKLNGLVKKKQHGETLRVDMDATPVPSVSQGQGTYTVGVDEGVLTVYPESNSNGQILIRTPTNEEVLRAEENYMNEAQAEEEGTNEVF